MPARRRKTAKRGKSTGKASFKPSSEPGGFEVLERRTNYLFVEIRNLNSRLERLEELLWQVREECAKLSKQRAPRPSPRGEGRPQPPERPPPPGGGPGFPRSLCLIAA